MERAVEELERTLEKAEQYLRDDVNYPEEMRCHVEAIEEDIGHVEKHRTSDKDLDKKATDLTIRARRLKREMKLATLAMEREKEEIQNKKEHASNATSQIEKVVERVSERKATYLKLPAIKIPPFSGEVENYRGFIEVFTDMIKEEPTLTDIKKWLLLREHLTGKALEMVRHLPIAPETYKVAIALLEQTFGSKRRATSHLYQRLQLLENAEVNDDSLRMVTAKMEGTLQSLEQLGENVNDNDFLRAVAIGKYPEEVTHLLRVTDNMTFAEFRMEIGSYIQSRETAIRQVTTVKAAEVGSKPVGKEADTKINRSRTQLPNGVNAGSSGIARMDKAEDTGTSSASFNKFGKKYFSKNPKCIFCSCVHWADECPTYKTLAQRVKIIGDRCHRCFKSNHGGAMCKRIIKCAHCGEVNHHRALCPKKFASVAPVLCAVDGDETSSVDNISDCEFLTLLLTVCNLSKIMNGSARAILDTASKRTLITRRLFEKLELKEEFGKTVKLVGVSSVPLSTVPLKSCKLYLCPPNQKMILIEAFIVDNIAENVLGNSVSQFKLKNPQYNNLEMPDEGNGLEVDLLIGYKALPSILTLKDSLYVNPKVQLLSTKFGWVVFGGINEMPGQPSEVTAALFSGPGDPIKLMTELDVLGLKEIESRNGEEEEAALKKFYESIEFTEGRYQVAWPWKYDPPQLLENFGLAWGRLQSLYKKLNSNKDLLRAYDTLIRDQVEKGIIEPVNMLDSGEGKLIHYIAHQVVLKLEKSTPVRIVYDASARINKNQKSLNDNILKGTNWVEELPSLLMRFRRYQTALTADVEKAFHQIAIQPKDRDVVRFIWLRDPRKPPTRDNLQIFRFKRVAFGIVASPFLLYATVRYHIRKNPHEFSGILETDFYADNLVVSLPDDVDLLRFYELVKGTFSSMSMNLGKWVTNSRVFLDFIPEIDQEKEIQQMVLGMSWNTHTDKMGLQKINYSFDKKSAITKRKVLKETASIFDPLGWAIPIVLIARIFTRHLWQCNYDWDQPIKDGLAKEWNSIRKLISEIPKIELPRMMFRGTTLQNAQICEIHAFADASAEAYGTVIFLRIEEELAFVAARARLSPKTKLSIPRLELLAAVIACRFAHNVKKWLKLKNKNEINFWGDSKCVLSWIKSTKLLPSYVDKAITEIKKCGIKNFHYVPTSMNPADVVSRGASFKILQDNNWWNGPQWLKKNEDWPKEIDLEEKAAFGAAERIQEEDRILFTRINLDLNKNQEQQKNEKFILDPAKFSTLTSLFKRTAFLVAAINRIFLTRIKKKPLPVEEEKINYTFVRKIWIKYDQKRAYKQIPPNKKSNTTYLHNLKILQDEEGIIRCETRLTNSAFSEETKNPVLLVKNSPLTILIVMHIHTRIFHAGTSHTLAELRKQYWLPHGRRQVFKIIRKNCAICKKYSAQPFSSPDMAPLPEVRVLRTSTPFQNAGMDVFGPFKIKTEYEGQRSFSKTWVIIFTCLVVRAVHLEVIEDMTSSEILMAFRRFAGRRGVPKVIVCDNAPQFHVIQGRFCNLWHMVKEDPNVVTYFANHEIEWKFIPANAPWMGGVYERLIKTVKDALEKTHPHFFLTQGQFTTVIVELEGIVNSRPISYVDKSIDTTIITPNNFLSVQYPAMPIQFHEMQPQDQISQIWKIAQAYLQLFWRKWADQYILALREQPDRMKNQYLAQKREPKVGEIVLMTDPTQKRSIWRKALIERLIQSQDGKIRSAQIKLANGGRMIRPIIKLVPLDLIADVPRDNKELNATHSALVFSGGGDVVVNDE